MKKVMGVGTALLMISGLAFTFLNYVMHIGLARFLGPETYGLFGVLMSLYLINRAFLNTGIPRAVSKFVASSGEISKSSLYLQLAMGSLFAFIYIIFAPYLASILKDTSLTPYIIFLGVMILPFSVLSLYLNGYINGLRLFKKQAIIKIIYPLLRVLLVFLFVIIGMKIFGVLLGFLISILLALLLCVYTLRKVKFSSNKKFSNEEFSNKTSINKTSKIIQFAFPITIASLAFTLMRNVNTLLIKYFLVDNSLVGFYTAAVTLSNISYVAFAALPLTLMPSISKAADNLPLIRKYLSESLRYLILLLFPLTALIAATSTSLVNLFYSSSYSQAGPLLSILIVSTTLLMIFSTLSSVITGNGKPYIEMFISLLMIVLLLFFTYFLLPLYGLIGAAYASLLTSFIALLIVGIYTFLKFNILMSLKSFFKISLSSLIIYLAAHYWHYSGSLLLLSYVILSFLYLSLLFIFNEVKRKDLSLINRLIKRT